LIEVIILNRPVSTERPLVT